MLEIKRALKSERIMKSLTGVSPSEFKALVSTFAAILFEESLKKERSRLPGAGAKHSLEEPDEKLFYALFYAKCYPTFDLAAFFYGVDRSQTCRWAHLFVSALEKALGRKLVLPKRRIKDAEEFIRLFPEINEVFSDGTERSVQRSKNKDKQKSDYSGKKKRHTRKYILLTDSEKRILVLGLTEAGKTHDYKAFKNTGIPESLPKGIKINVDLGFQGIKKDYPHLDVLIPHKKPRGKELSPEQKVENRIISSHRILVENAICGVKRLKSLTDIYRNKVKNFEDVLMNVGCGLWNYHLEAA